MFIKNALHPKTRSALGAIDIGGTKVAVGLVTPRGRLLSQQSFPTMEFPRLANALVQIVGILRTMTLDAGVALSGIGIGCTGQMHPTTGAIAHLEYLPDWEGPGLVASLERTFGVPVRLANDAEAAALGEWSYGVGKGVQSFVMVTIGTGIGVGVINQGRLWRGVSGAHPEIGHHIIEKDGPGCYCGGHGCWESLASGTALERWMDELQPVIPALKAIEICALVEQGNEIARRAVERTAGYLGIGIANLVNIFAPEVIALSGGLMHSSHLFLPSVQASIEKNCKLVPYKQVQIRLASLGNEAVLLGAASLLKQKRT